MMNAFVQGQIIREEIGMRAANEFFSAPVRMEMSPKMIEDLTEVFCSMSHVHADVKWGFRFMAGLIAMERKYNVGLAE